MGDPTTLSENLREIREANRAKLAQVVSNWKELLPDGSRWFPGSTGKPNCPHCHGIGWVRRDLPVGHPEFGKLVECTCSR